MTYCKDFKLKKSPKDGPKNAPKNHPKSKMSIELPTRVVITEETNSEAEIMFHTTSSSMSASCLSLSL